MNRFFLPAALCAAPIPLPAARVCAFTAAPAQTILSLPSAAPDSSAAGGGSALLWVTFSLSVLPMLLRLWWLHRKNK